MKFSSIAVAAFCLSAHVESFAGPQIKPRFGVQVRQLEFGKTLVSCEKDTVRVVRLQTIGSWHLLIDGGEIGCGSKLGS